MSSARATSGVPGQLRLSRRRPPNGYPRTCSAARTARLFPRRRPKPNRGNRFRRHHPFRCRPHRQHRALASLARCDAGPTRARDTAPRPAEPAASAGAARRRTATAQPSVPTHDCPGDAHRRRLTRPLPGRARQRVGRRTPCRQRRRTVERAKPVLEPLGRDSPRPRRVPARIEPTRVGNLEIALPPEGGESVPSPQQRGRRSQVARRHEKHTPAEGAALHKPMPVRGPRFRGSGHGRIHLARPWRAPAGPRQLCQGSSQRPGRAAW